MFCFVFYKIWYIANHISRVSYQKGPTRHAYVWQIGHIWQDNLDICMLDPATVEWQLHKTWSAIATVWIPMKLTRTEKS